jgi:hypothetical protein
MWADIEKEILGPIEREAQDAFVRMKPDDVGAVAKVQALLRVIRKMQGAVAEIITAGTYAQQQLEIYKDSTPPGGD